MRMRVRRFAHVLERIGLAMAGAASGLFVGIHVGSSITALTSLWFLLIMMVSGAVGFYMESTRRPIRFTCMMTKAPVQKSIPPNFSALSVRFDFFIRRDYRASARDTDRLDNANLVGLDGRSVDANRCRRNRSLSWESNRDQAVSVGRVLSECAAGRPLRVLHLHLHRVRQVGRARDIDPVGSARARGSELGWDHFRKPPFGSLNTVGHGSLPEQSD
jgi:hypothetical protein